jgi:hypothetical protein
MKCHASYRLERVVLVGDLVHHTRRVLHWSVVRRRFLRLQIRKRANQKNLPTNTNDAAQREKREKPEASNCHSKEENGKEKKQDIKIE